MDVDGIVGQPLVFEFYPQKFHLVMYLPPFVTGHRNSSASARGKTANSLIFSEMLGKFTLFIDDFWNAGYVKVQGTWIQLSGENPYTENIRSIIQCSKDTKACVEAQVGVVEKTFLALSLETYEIERWDQQEIVTKPRDAVCARDILRSNRSQKSVTAINSTISTKGLCEGVDAAERYFVLSDPSKIDKQLLEEHSKKVRELLSPELRQALDNMNAEVSKN